MTLQSGTRLGPYEILAPIGAGGMGEVYQARDTRLGRNVAIKILAAGSGDRAMLRVRFDREARAISALNHPHICTLHDVGSENDIDYLVMEHCEGKTLARRLADGPLPIGQVIGYAQQIADALDKAHRRGIIHRDLKPSNIMITKSGVKVLDFGLAREHRGDVTPDESTVRQVSEEGALPGTVHYMAPEVLNGKVADARSDIYALGLVLSEMVTGQRAFDGASRASVIAAILELEPKPVVELRPDASPALVRLIDACLVKDPDERIQSAHDVMLELQWGAEGNVAPQIRHSRLWIGMAAVLAIVTLLLAIIIIGTPRSEPVPIRRLTISLPADAAVKPFDGFGEVGNLLAISPDGRRLVYVGPQGLYIRDLDQLTAQRIPGTEDASGPFFSPDGNWIGFASGTRLKKVALAGGRPVTVHEGQHRLRGAVWGSDDRIIFAQFRGSLMRIAASGGAPQPLTPENLRFRAASGVAPQTLTLENQQVRWPFVLPGGREILLTASHPSGNSDRDDVVMMTLADGKLRTIIQGATYGQYVASGHLVYLHSGTIFRVPFDLRAKKITGEPQPILDDVDFFHSAGLAGVAASGRTLYYLPSDPLAEQRELVWADRRGHVTSAVDKRQGYATAQLSPDGKQILATIYNRDGWDVWRHEINRAMWSRLTSDKVSDWPIWSPDGHSIVYRSNRDGPINLFMVPSDGSGEPKRLTNRESRPLPCSWSPDGKLIAVTEVWPATGQDIWFIPADGKSAAIPWLTTAAQETWPSFSPDGRWVAYQSSQSGVAEIYLRAASGNGPSWQVSVSGGEGTAWRRDGKQLFYVQGTALMAVDVRTTSTIHLGKPHVIVDGPFTYCDVTADGQRVLSIRTPQLAPRTRINVVEGLLD